MRDAITWSYDLLGAPEQAVFRRLGVLVGGFGLDAAAAVADREAGAIAEHLEALLNQSLVRREERGDGDPRFGMLETIREFALDQLVASGERAEVARRHASYFADLVRRAETALWTAGADDWIGVFGLEADQANIRAALHWLAADDPIRHVRMAGPLGMFWYEYGHLAEGRRWLDGALTIAARLGDILPAPDHALALMGSGLISQMQGDVVEAQSSLEQGLARAAEAGGSWRAMVARSLLSGVLVSRGRYDEAEPLFEVALAQWRTLENPIWTGHALFHLGLVRYARRDWDGAVPLLADAVPMYEGFGDELGASDPLHYLALVACERGDFARAAGIMADVLGRLRRRGSEPALADGLADVATLATCRGDPAVSARLFGAAARLLEAGGGAYSLPGRETYERVQATTRQVLPEADWLAEFAAGRAMPPD